MTTPHRQISSEEYRVEEVRRLTKTETDRLTTVPNRPDAESETEWRDPWAVAQEIRATLPKPARNEFLVDLSRVSHRITDEINADPVEAQKLRKARQEAREGKTFPRSRSKGTKSS